MLSSPPFFTVPACVFSSVFLSPPGTYFTWYCTISLMSFLGTFLRPFPSFSAVISCYLLCLLVWGPFFPRRSSPNANFLFFGTFSHPTGLPLQDRDFFFSHFLFHSFVGSPHGPDPVPPPGELILRFYPTARNEPLNQSLMWSQFLHVSLPFFPFHPGIFVWSPPFRAVQGS